VCGSDVHWVSFVEFCLNLLGLCFQFLRRLGDGGAEGRAKGPRLHEQEAAAEEDAEERFRWEIQW